MRISPVFLSLTLALLAGCGGGGGDGGTTTLPNGKTVKSGPFESYVTQHNGYSRVRMDRATAADQAAIAAFEDSNPADPAGYRNLIALQDKALASQMTIEVLAKVDEADKGRVTRVVRLTADQAPFENVRNGKLVTASGQYYFRGASYAWVTIDGGPVLSGHHDNGLESLVLDFDKGTASIDLRTEVAGTSEVEIDLQAKDLPFNIVTGAYGGATTIHVRNPGVDETYALKGRLRGNVGGSPTYANGQHQMTTSGLYTASGKAKGHALTVDGVYVGKDPNAAH